MPTKIGLHAMNFLSQFYFLTPMDYSLWFEREIWPNLKESKKAKNLQNWRSHAGQTWYTCFSHQVHHMVFIASGTLRGS